MKTQLFEPFLVEFIKVNFKLYKSQESLDSEELLEKTEKS